MSWEDVQKKIDAVSVKMDSTSVRLDSMLTKKDGNWSSFADWNNAYTKLLQKRNQVEREYRASSDPVKQEKLKAKLTAAELAMKQHTDDPNRPSSYVMRNLVREVK